MNEKINNIKFAKQIKITSIIILIISSLFILTTITTYKVNQTTNQNTNKQLTTYEKHSLADKYVKNNLNNLKNVAKVKKITSIEHKIIKKVSQPKIRNIVYNIKPNDNLSTVFTKFHLNKNLLNDIWQNKELSKYLNNLHAHNAIKIQLINNEINNLFIDIDQLRTIQIKIKQNEILSWQKKEYKLSKKIILGTIKVHNSLFEDGIKQNVPIKIISKLVDIFTWDIDFHSDLHENDTFKIIYEQNYVKGKPFSIGNILAAGFYNKNKNFYAMRFYNNHKADYYDLNGRSLRKAFIRSPVKYTRISSRFTKARKHPILHRIRAHKGIDFAAPYGTPIKAAGDGKIIFIGRKGGYGNAVIIKHMHDYSTLYGHLSKFNRYMLKNKKVNQGDIIGYVGSTGLANGPHLHFEFRIKNVHKDPLTVIFPRASIIPNNKKQFNLYAFAMFKKLIKSSSHDLTQAYNNLALTNIG